jgi:hypothetical protein
MKQLIINLLGGWLWAILFLSGSPVILTNDFINWIKKPVSKIFWKITFYRSDKKGWLPVDLNRFL